MYCYNCNSTGIVVSCRDDICRGQEWCMHGDGESVCPECLGDPDDEEMAAEAETDSEEEIPW